MSGTYYVVANQDEGGRWDFSGEQLAALASEVRPGATVSGPFGDSDAYHIEIPGEEDWKHEVLYQAQTMTFSFEEENEIDLTGGLVFQILQRLAPTTPAIWVADFDGTIHSLQIEGRSEEDFVRELWS